MEREYLKMAERDKKSIAAITLKIMERERISQNVNHHI